MNQQIEFAKPNPNAKSINELPKSVKMVKAVSLLRDHEQTAVPKIAAFITVAVGDEIFAVRPHDFVPAQATVVRSKTDALVGIAAVVGG